MDPDHPLDEVEARVLGVLGEKSLTTPDHYPLTANAATAGCNQKSNRDPVMELSESRVQSALETLMVRGYAGLVHASGGRTDRYRHNLREQLELDERQLALFTVLLLRGPQTRGELRTHTRRMTDFDDLDAVAAAARPLVDRGLLADLPPTPGSRSRRYARLLAPGSEGTRDAAAAQPSAPSLAPATDVESRVAALEETVRALEARLAELTDRLGG